MKINKYLFIFLFVMSAFKSQGQDDLENLLDKTEIKTKDYVGGTFKGTRVINLHSVERVAPGALQFIISHRFGAVNGGPVQFWGLDQATIRIGLEYGLAKWIMVGLGRSSYQKNYDAFAKISLVRQSTGLGSFPVSILYFGSVVESAMPWADKSRTNYFSSRLTYVNQIIIGRKITNNLSLEFVPTQVIRNMVATKKDDNIVYAIGIGGRYKISKRVSINAEYIYRLPQKNIDAPSATQYFNSLSMGFDIETGGHVFQLQLTNSLSMIEKGFITENAESWRNGGIHYGFNISRDFVLSKKKVSRK